MPPLTFADRLFMQAMNVL